MNQTIELGGERSVEEGGTLVLRCQNQADRVNAQKLCPHDQQRPCVMEWRATNELVIRPAPQETTSDDTAGSGATPAGQVLVAEKIRLKGLTPGELRTIAAERGVKWKVGASTDTMIDLIAAAAPPAPPNG